MHNNNLGDKYEEMAINYLGTEDSSAMNYEESPVHAFSRVQLDSKIMEKMKNILDYSS